MPAPLTQEQWDTRAKKARFEWLEPVRNGSTPTRARCLKCGNKWTFLRPDKTKRGMACPACAIKERDDKRRLPQEEWDRRAAKVGMEWLGPVLNGRDPVEARCLTCGEVSRRRGDAVARGTGCFNCKGSKPIDMSEWNMRAESVGVRFLEDVQGAHHSVSVECLVCGNEYKAKANQISNGFGCRKCTYESQKITQEEWDERAAAKDIIWLEKITHGKTPCLARCLKCGTEWRAAPTTVYMQTGCPRCAPYGFSPDLPSNLYLLAKDNLIAKIGVTGADPLTTERRLSKLARHGYKDVKLWGLPDGHLALQIEAEVLTWWREWLGTDPAAKEMEFEGWTETVSISEVSLEEIIAFVDEEVSRVLDTNERS